MTHDESLSRLLAGADASVVESPGVSDTVHRASQNIRVGDYRTAAKLLTEALEGSPEQGGYLLHDLRALCLLHAGEAQAALDDSMYCTKLKPDWARGWARLGAAQLRLGHAQAAASAYKRGLALHPGAHDMELGLQLASEALEAAAGRRDAVHHA